MSSAFLSAIGLNTRFYIFIHIYNFLFQPNNNAETRTWRINIAHCRVQTLFLMYCDGVVLAKDHRRAVWTAASLLHLTSEHATLFSCQKLTTEHRYGDLTCHSQQQKTNNKSHQPPRTRSHEIVHLLKGSRTQTEPTLTSLAHNSCTLQYSALY